ncbi:MAG: glycosyltransferase family 4 protein [Ferruginibacter sp.]|nr:glycosyltransferase family 4 protein [Cytophagales bacterium]
MKVLYIHQHFSTLAEGGSTRSYYLAKALVDAGISVELITRHNHPVYAVKNVEGIRVHYLPVYYDNAQGFNGRVRAFLKFAILAYRTARRVPDVDLCYAVSTPLTTGLIALALRRFGRIPYCFEVGDLWPLAPVQLGVIRNRLLKRLLFALEKQIYREAASIVALSPGIRDGIAQVVPGKQIHLIPNVADCDFFRMEDKDPALASAFGVAGKLVVTYFGTIGRANHLEYLLTAARSCQTVTDSVAFLIVGKGAELPNLQRLAAAYALKNLRFLPHVDKYALRDVLNVTDAVYISFASVPVLATGSPNKFFDALAAGKPCLVNFGGWIRELVEREQCGRYVNPAEPETFYAQIEPFLRDPSRLVAYQRNARTLAETRFSRKQLTREFVRIIQQVGEQSLVNHKA